MSQIVFLNSVPYVIPSTGETGWGQQTTAYLVAVSTAFLPLSGGTFTLLADVDFGPNFGILSPYFKSGQADPSATGVLRLTNTESVAWRNAADSADLALSVTGDVLYFDGMPVGGSTSPLTTKGDLYTYSTTNDRLPVGANGSFLTADSTEATGLKWVTVGAPGSVTSVSIVSANGFAGSVANASTTPAITLTTSVTGILKGNGTAISAAIAADFPTLNQNTTGNANTATTASSVTGLTLANTLTTSGNFALTLTQTATTNVTLPTTGTLATRAGAETLTNKTITSPTITGAIMTGTTAVNGPMTGNITEMAGNDMDLSTANYFTKTMAANTTFTFSNIPATTNNIGWTMELNYTSGTPTWPASVIWPGNVAPTFTGGHKNLVSFTTRDGGTTVFGATLLY